MSIPSIPSLPRKAVQRFAAAGVVGALAATVGLVATATPATATPGARMAGVFIYANPNYSIPVYPSGAPTWVSALGGPAHDTTSSISNSTDLRMCFYEHTNFRGLEFRIGPGEWWATIPSWIDNKISSYRPC
ncbi:hypothetical protein ABT354_09325 [Streptomyces sp. NPDC000594]|uniref:hypothetical protein n=1 Tax=Streptomyces sp. NPDC000594 TaxID=3154261 RepID=UPI00331FC692